VSDDGTTIHVCERYADSAVAVAHLEAFAKRFAGQFDGMVERKTFSVFGYPSAESQAVLDGFNAIYLRPFYRKTSMRQWYRGRQLKDKRVCDVHHTGQTADRLNSSYKLFA
jgi:hypothetical protein